MLGDGLKLRERLNMLFISAVSILVTNIKYITAQGSNIVVLVFLYAGFGDAEVFRSRHQGTL